MGIREKIEGTYEGEIIEKLDLVYKKIAQEQKEWRDACGFDCVEGCGKCCVNFEPDILESEALYLASWMLDNKRETAEKIIDGMKIYTAQEMEAALEKAGFTEVRTNHHGSKSWMCVLAMNPA